MNLARHAHRYSFNGDYPIAKRLSSVALCSALIAALLMAGVAFSPTRAQHFAVPFYSDIPDTRRTLAKTVSPQPLKLFATTTVDRTQAYVGEQILVTREVLAPSVAFNLRQQKFVVDGADVYALKKFTDSTYKNNTPYEREQTIYAVFFKKPGIYEIPSTTYTATLPMSNAGPGAKNNPKITTKILKQSISVNAAPVPGNRWLAATALSASAEWRFEDSDSPFVEGQPIARLYKFSIAGQLPSAIPKIELSPVEGIRFYANTAQAESSDDRTGVRGQLTQIINMIPGDSGVFDIPRLSVNWWDINKQQWNTATVPADSIEVRPSPVSKMVEPNDKSALVST